jgi:hypothetical protein
VPEINNTLPDELLEDLRRWWNNMTNPPLPDLYMARGLWVCGDPGFGTSYVARRAMNRAEQELNWPFAVVKKNSVRAVQLQSAIRDVWSLENGVRHNSDDFVLWQEFDRANQQVDWWLDDAPVSLIDDLHTGYDASFWAKHVAPRLEAKIKGGKGVIIASDMSPDEVIGEKWPNLFVVCSMDAPLAER